MQVRPKPGPFRCAGDDRDVGVGRQVHQQLDEDVLQDGIHGRFSPAQSLEVDPGVARRSTKSAREAVSTTVGGSGRSTRAGVVTAHTARRWAGQPIPSSRRRVRMPLLARQERAFLTRGTHRCPTRPLRRRHCRQREGAQKVYRSRDGTGNGLALPDDMC